MKTIGLLGGMSWESTIPYYRIINEEIRSALGGLHSAKVLLYSVDFQEIEACQAAGDWDRSAALLSDAAAGLERAGADFTKTSTGYAPGGSTIEDLKLMRANTSPRMQVKAAGGIRTLDDTLDIMATGTIRIGTRSTEDILKEAYRREAEGTLVIHDRPDGASS